MSFKDDMKAKIVDVAEFMQMTDEITGRSNPIPIKIDDRMYALVLHPVEDQTAETVDEKPTEPPAPEDAPAEEAVVEEFTA